MKWDFPYKQGRPYLDSRHVVTIIFRGPEDLVGFHEHAPKEEEDEKRRSSIADEAIYPKREGDINVWNNANISESTVLSNPKEFLHIFLLHIPEINLHFR